MIEFYNTNKKRPVIIRRGAIVGADYDATHKTNIIYVPGGMFPVQESLEEIATKTNSPVGQEKKKA